MAEGTSAQDYDDEFDFKLQDKPKKKKKQRRDSEKNALADDLKTELLECLNALEIPAAASASLNKHVNNGQVTGFGKVLHRSGKAIIVSGKVNKTHRNFPLLTSDDAIFKIHLPDCNDRTKQIKRADEESARLKTVVEKLNRPTLLAQSGNIVIMTLIGKDGVPAKTLKEVLHSTNRKINELFNEFFLFWCLEREKAFDPSNYLYHDGKWWSVGLGVIDDLFNQTDVSNEKLRIYHSHELKAVINFFMKFGLSIKQAEEGFKKSIGVVDWYLTEKMRGMTQNKTEFEMLYS